MIELWQRCIDWIKDLMTNKLRVLGLLRSSILKLDDPYLKWLPLDHYVVSIVQTVSTKDWLQKVDLAFHVKVRGDGELWHKRCIHCVWLPWMVILVVEGVRCHVLLANRVSMGHVTSIMCALVTVMCPWFFHECWWYRRVTQFKLRLVGSIIHHAALYLLHLCHIGGSFHFWF